MAAEVQFEADEADLMEEAEPQPQPTRLRSTVGAVKKQKGRGFNERMADDRPSVGQYESLSTERGQGPAKSVEGWCLFVTGVHEEAQEEDLLDTFGEYGEVRNLYLNLDRRTGFVKGYAIIEFGNKKEAQDAIDGLDGQELLTQRINVSWAFVNGPGGAGGGRRPRRR